LRDRLYRLLGHLALTGLVQAVELAPGVRPAADHGDLACRSVHELLVSTEVMRSSQFVQERFGIGPRSAFAKVVYRGFDVLVGSCRMRPHIPLAGLALQIHLALAF
jgi:hypothetical protein